MIIAETAEATAEVVEKASSTGDIVVFSILIVIIATISIYEYFSSVRWQQATSDIRNDIVFASKNKYYGAYSIRKNYNRNMMFIILGLILFLGLTYGGAKVYSKFANTTSEEEEQQLKQVVIDYIEEPEEEEQIEEPEPEEIPEQQLEDQAAFLPPVVTDEEVNTDPPVIKELSNTNVGKENIEGNTLIQDEPVVKKPPVIEKKPDEIETTVDERAEFPGGNTALYKFLQQNIQYPEIAIQLDLSGKSVLQFVVNTDGSIQSVKVLKPMRDCRECDQEAVRVVKSMPKWAPGKKGGKAVRSYFVLPVNFKVN